MTKIDRLALLKNLSPAEKALLAQKLRERKATAGVAFETGIPRRDGIGLIPLSSGQRRMWLAQQMDPESPAANLLAPLRLDGTLDVRALAMGLTEVTRRHEVLRMGIEAPDGEPVPTLRPTEPLPLPLIDLAGLPGLLAEEESLRLAAAEAGRPFDLSRPPVMRAKLARTAAGSHLLLLTLHHVAADGWSIAILVHEMVALYGAFAAGLPSPLPELPIQYADYAAWQQGRLAAGELAADLLYWRQRLAGLPPLDLLRDRDRPAASATRTVRPSLVLPAGLSDRLQELARQERGTLFMALAAAFAVFLGRLAEQDDVAFATPIAGRTRSETEGLIGFFVNTLVLRADLGGNPTLRHLMVRLRTAIAEAHAHQELPFERLVEELAPERRAGRHPLVQALLAFQNVPQEIPSLPGLTVSTVEVKAGVALFDLALQVEPWEGGLLAKLELDEALWGATAVSRLPQALGALLAAAAADPDLPVRELPFLSAAQRRQVLAPPVLNGAPAATSDASPPAPPRIPAGEMVGRVAAIWAEVLGLPEVGEHDSFWQLGGHSLLAARVTARVRQDFGIDLPLRVLFEASTPAELAAVLAGRAGGPLAEASPLLRAERDRDRPLPLSFGQQRLWFLHQMAPESPAYNIPLAVRMDGALDARALAAALTEVVRRHEVLRTAIVTRRGEATQEIAPPALLPMLRADLSALPTPRREKEARRLAAEEGHRPFDLTRPPLLRVLLVQLGDAAHLLAFDLHHIAGDGWSGSILVRETGALYRAFAAGLPSPLPEPSLQYADYARWQRAELTGETLARLLAYWRERLEGLPPLALPTDRPRPAVESFRGAQRSRRMPAGLASSLERLAGDQGATLFMVLAAGLAALLGRLSGQEDFGLAAPVAGRTRTELEGLIGFFVNTLVLRADLAGDPPFVELLGRMRETALAAFSHQDLPFERLVEEIGARRDPARQPLAQALIVFQNTPREPLVLPGLTLTPEEIDGGTAKLDLSLSLGRDEEGLDAGLEVNRDLFDPATAARMLEQLEVLLAAAGDDPRLPVSALPLLSPAARHQVVVEWDQRHDGELRAVPHLPPLHRLFEAVAARRPEAVAVTGETDSLTYGELDRRANRLARHLRALGVGPETRVGLCLPPSPELVMAILAILKAGGAYVPLDPGYPKERLAFLLEDSRAPLVVTRSELAGSLDGPGRVLLDAEDRLVAGLSARPLSDASGAGPDHPAYVIYTSGSTGHPKGVAVTHRNVARLFAATAPGFGFGEGDVWTLFHSFAFDFSVWEIWGALLHGGRLVVVPYWVSRAPDAFLGLIRREGVTVLNQTPSAFRQLIPVACRDGADAAGDLPLRWVIFGGEALDPRHLAPWFERFGDRSPRLINMYGITETTVHVTWRPLAAADAGTARSPIGRPIPDLSIRLLDRTLRPVPIGLPGEICVAGAGVARGYLGRPELTAERFLPDPSARLPGERLYRSGDLARWLAGGDLEVLGRIDSQVKVRGFRIEPGEIEAALESHPGVRESAVLAPEGENGERRLVAWVVPRGEAVPAAGLRAFLQDRLPGHMVPAAFVALPALPLTRHGKLDRAALPAPGFAAVSAAPFAPPETPVERAVAASWGEVLDLPRVGLDDDFFALGGDSIRAIQVRARAEERRVLFTLQDLFRFPTVRALARAVRTLAEGSAGEERTGAPAAGDLLSPEDRARLPEGIEDAFPLARTLAGLVFHSEYSPDYLIYLTSFHLQVPFDAGCLQEALTRMVARHPILRSSLALEGFSEPLHLVHGQVFVPLEVEDLRHLAPEEQEEAFDRWFAAEQRRKFDWRQPPLARLRVHRRGDESFQLTLSEPFLDGWSVGLFLTELFHRYLVLLPAGAVPAAAELAPPDDRPLAAAYRDYVALEREALASTECRLYWDRRMDGGGAGRLPASPVNRRAPDPGQSLVGRREVPVSAAVSDGLWAAARAASAPLKNLLLAVHLKALSFLTGSSDVVSGVLANGRPEGADGDRVIGGFLNAMPFRVDLAPGSWLALARQVFDAERELLAYRRFPLSELQQKQPGVGRPLFDTLFNFTHFHVYDRLARFPGLTVLAGGGTEQTYFPLTVQFNVQELTHGVTLAFDHPLADLGALEVEAIAARYSRILDAVAADPGASHDALCLLDARERQQIVVEWSATPGPPGAGRAVHELFAEQAARTPEAPALLWGEETVAYGQLAARAGRVARRLLDLGLPPEARVAVLLDRSPDLVAAILGVLQAGGAYVPLDPDYPRERLDAMLGDSGARALVTRRGLGPWDQTGETPFRIDLEELAGPAPALPAELPGVDPAQLFVVIYTSGSTGRPKGVAVEHRSVSAFLAGTAALHPPEELTGMLAGASVCFDLSIFEIFLPLTQGGAAVLAASALDLPRLPARDAVRLAAFVPSSGAELLRGGGIPTGVRAIFMGGEALPPGLARAFLETPGRRLFNAYGPTEATIYAILARIDAGETGTPPIGHPVPGGRALLLDADLQPVLPGVPGEIWLGGRGLARGYLGRPDLTAERFRPDPWGAPGGEPGGRLYRTGDLGHRRPDGQIEFLGRRDNQVKVRGFRIELGEVESALARHPGIEAAVVLDSRDPAAPGEARLIAYAVPRRGLPASGPWAAELRGFLRRLLPAYMVPSDFVVLDALPFTATGKVDRRALPAPGTPAPGTGGPAAARPWTAPRTPVEEVLCGLWAQVFRLPRVSADDDFFDLGGHSLLATQLISRLRETFALELPLRALFTAPGLADLAREIERALREGEGIVGSPLAPQPRPDGGVPLSFAQQRLWFLDRLEPESPFYNVPLAVRLLGRLDLPALAAALGEIVRRHEALRTRFVEVAGRPVQVVERQVAVAIPVSDLSGLPAAGREAEAARLARAEARRPFDLERGPLLRVSLLRLGAQESLLLAVFHHIVSDGWSLGVFLRETAELYRAAAAGEPSPLPPLPLQYADFTLWQRGWLAGEALDRQLGWWRRQLADVPPLALPTDRPRPATPAYRGARCPLALPPAAAAEIAGLARREGATLFMTLLAAFSAVLGRWAGQELLAVGTPVANRTRVELEPLIGFFVNTLALRADLSGDPTGRTLLGRCREMALGAYAHQDLPFEKLVEELRPERDLARAPLFQALLSLQNTPPADFKLPGLTLAPVAIEPGTAKFDLTLSAMETPEGIGAWLEHDAHLFDPATVARLAGHFAAVLQGLAADPGHRLSDLPLLAAGERQQTLREWAEPSPLLPGVEGVEGLGIADRIAAQARRTPDAVAVAQGDREITYRDLHDRAGRLAGSLRARGVGPEVAVAIRLPKSPEAIVAILAVLRAGGAYLPLDPAYPEERLAWMAADAGAVLTLDEAGDEADPAVAAYQGPGPGPMAPSASPAYVLYTSGSTGRPKGVVVTRAGLLASTQARLEGYTAPVSAFLLIPSLAFDSSVAGLFWTLCQGGTLVLPGEGEAADPVRLAELVEARRVSHWLGIPSLWRMILDAAPSRRLRSLAAVIVAGEPCPADLPRRHAAALPGVPLLNEYGPTEGTVWATAGELVAGERITIGRPIAGTRVLLLDRGLDPAPAGVPAELFLGGAGLARGYLGRPDLTAERFVPDPWSAGPGARLYRTGDLARWLPDGRLDLLGRADDQVKIRGFRVEPGEVEAALERCAGVRQAAVGVRELPSGDRRLTACVVASGDLDPEALRRDLAGRLPAHMIPAELAIVETLPLSPNGKVDREALKRLFAARAAAPRSAEPPAGDLERRLAAIWEELLDVRGVGRGDGFFDLGGHSLLAVELLARIERDLGRRLPLAALFRGATLASLAAAINTGAPAPAASPLVLLQEGSGRPFFCCHPLGGRVSCYADLAHRLSGRPLYGLESPGETASLEDLAARHAGEILGVQPRGPYLLGGWSFGGVVAWETARRLESLGHEVGLLVLIDSRPHDPHTPMSPMPPDLGDAALDALLGAEAGVEEESLPGLRAVVRAHLQALRGYRSQPVAAPVALFLAADRQGGVEAAAGHAALWRPLAAGGLEVEILPGDHFHLLTGPAADLLAAKLNARLAQSDDQPA